MSAKYFCMIAVLLFTTCLVSCSGADSVADKKPDLVLSPDSLEKMISGETKGKELDGKIIQTSGKVTGMSSMKINNGAEGSATLYIQDADSPFTIRCDFNTALEDEDPMGKEFVVKGEFSFTAPDDFALINCAVVK